LLTEQAAAGTELEVITGVEVNSEGDWGDLHILGYHVDLENGPLQERMRMMREARIGRAREMIQLLGRMDMPLDWETVRTLAGGESVGRPHIARALLDEGYVETMQEAFDRFIANGGPAYVPRLRLSPPEVIQTIIEAGGVPVLAHAVHSGEEAVALIPELVSYGLQGLEVYYPNHSSKDVAMLLEMCQQYDLLSTGGTDFHGPNIGEGAPLGSIHVPMECVEQLRRAVTDDV